MEKEIKELQDKLNALKLKYEQSKKPFKDGDVVEDTDGTIVKIISVKQGTCYGLSCCGEWMNYKDIIFNSTCTHSTPEKWLEVCTKEAVKRGLVEGAKIDRSVFNNIEYYNLTLLKNGCPEYLLFHNGNTLECYGKVILQNGIWAEVIKTDKTLEELSEDRWECDVTVAEHIKANPEAYTKAIAPFLKINLHNQK